MDSNYIILLYGQRCKRSTVQASVSSDIHSWTFISLRFHTAIIAETQVSFFRTQISFIAKICFEAEEEKIEGILNREAMSVFYFFIVIMKRSNFPYVLHKQILWCFTNKRFFLFFFFFLILCFKEKKAKPKVTFPYLFLICYYRHIWKQKICNELEKK